MDSTRWSPAFCVFYLVGCLLVLCFLYSIKGIKISAYSSKATGKRIFALGFAEEIFAPFALDLPYI
jgi:hypothetical protein